MSTDNEKAQPVSTGKEKAQPTNTGTGAHPPAINSKTSEMFATSDGQVVKETLKFAKWVLSTPKVGQESGDTKRQGSNDPTVLQAVVAALGGDQVLKGRGAPCRPSAIFAFNDGEKDLGVVTLCSGVDQERTIFLDPQKKKSWVLTIADRSALEKLLTKHLNLEIKD